MAITRSADDAPGISARVFTRLLDIPPQAAALFDAPGAGSPFATRAWFECSVAAAMPPDAEPCFVTLHEAGRVRALVPLQRRDRGRRLESLTTPYTCLYRPLLAEHLPQAGLVALGHAFGRFCRSWPTVRLDAMPSGDPDLATFLQATRRAGLRELAFAHFGNWHDDVAGLSWADYLRARPGGLRETIRRKLARAERDPAIGFELIRDAADVARAIAIYEAVYARSWKELEPFPAFNPTLMAAMAGIGMLRLGVLSRGGEAVAVQFWVVSGGIATILKLAHDEAAKAVSPGTVLTAMMLRHLLDGEHVRAIDFGRGDDPYKQGWASRRRERIGMVLVNPLRPAGLAFAARHAAGRMVRALRGT